MTPAKPDLKKYTRAEVAIHCTDKDLWVIINGKVYNFSGYAKSHPGGD
jgi:cytochrome b involved in lipid metabolism